VSLRGGGGGGGELSTPPDSCKNFIITFIAKHRPMQRYVDV
jgi:hypothetical protein